MTELKTPAEKWCGEPLTDAGGVAFAPAPPVTSPRSAAESEGGRPVLAPTESEPAEPSGYSHGYLASLSMLDLVPALSPQHVRPVHLTDWCAIIERAANEPIRALCSIPIRHYKTVTTIHGIIYLLLKNPTWRIIFLTHSAEAAEKWGKAIRQLAEATPVGPTRGWNKIAEWRNDKGGGVVVMSADQSKIGYDCDALIVDDPIDERGAEDQQTRDNVDDAISLYTARCMKRGKRGPVLIVASRFHTDDPIGRRIQRLAVKWECIQHAAILDEGLPTERAFAPDVWPLDELKATRAELKEKDPFEKVWWSQFQNDPKPIGSDLFRGATYYDELPDEGYRIGFGVDMAFTIGDGSDWFARVVARLYGNRLYLTDVIRHKIHPAMIEETCKADMRIHGQACFFSYMSGPEIGTALLLIEQGVPIEWMPARYNKLVRAQRTIRRWNDGEILVPSGAPWVRPFLARLHAFRGSDKERDDDEPDALVSLADGLMGTARGGVSPRTLGKSYAGLWVQPSGGDAGGGRSPGLMDRAPTGWH